MLHQPCGRNISPNVQPEPLKSQLIIVPYYSDVNSLLYLNPHPLNEDLNRNKIATLSLMSPVTPLLPSGLVPIFVLHQPSRIEYEFLYEIYIKHIYTHTHTTLFTAALKRWVSYLQGEKKS